MQMLRICGVLDCNCTSFSGVARTCLGFCTAGLAIGGDVGVAAGVVIAAAGVVAIQKFSAHIRAVEQSTRRQRPEIKSLYNYIQTKYRHWITAFVWS